MAGALLYQPKRNWRVGVAFGSAALIHFGAIAIAGIRHLPTEDALSGQNEFTSVDFVDSPPAADAATPPPDDLTAPSPIPNPAEEPMFIEPKQTPSPVRRQTPPRTAPITRPRNAGPGTVSLSSARVTALSAPRPEYPYEAKRLRITGNGIVVMTVDPISGNVTDVILEVSTGHPMLDNAAVAGFRKWRFRPGAVFRVKAPITYTLTGAVY
jgi:TonB family protein